MQAHLGKNIQKKRHRNRNTGPQHHVKNHLVGRYFHVHVGLKHPGGPQVKGNTGNKGHNPLFGGFHLQAVYHAQTLHHQHPYGRKNEREGKNDYQPNKMQFLAKVAEHIGVKDQNKQGSIGWKQQRVKKI